MNADVAIVVIGRNEGERLKRCLASLPGTRQAVYVDSGSTDGSCEMARAMDVDVLGLDARAPFTAARARNEGFARIRERAPDVEYVQFVDGDCELAPGWLEPAAGFLGARPDVAVVCGRLRERDPQRSVYNLLSDIEWDQPAGEALACGGIALVRASAFAGVGGFRPGMVAGEEPELCVRLRAAGWRIWRLDAEMATHDAAMTRFGQWWQRTKRAGYAFAEGAALHGGTPERHWVRESRSALFWAGVVPAAVIAAVAAWGAWGLCLLAVYPLQVVRLALRGKRGARANWWRALFLVLGKFPEMLGQIEYRNGGRSR
jgi:GT2 family glycosyltransferase